MRAKFLKKFFSPIHNINEKSFQYKSPIKSYKKLPILNHEKSLAFSRALNFHLPDNNYPLLKSKNNIIRNEENKQGIIWLKDEYLKIPKLILDKKINIIETPSSERKLHMTKSYKRLKINNSTFNITKGDDFPFFNKFEMQKDINEVLGLKKEKSDLNLFSYKKKEIDFDKYIQKMGVLKFLDEKILKLVRVGKVENKAYVPGKTFPKEKKKTNNKYKEIISRYLLSKKSWKKDNMKYSVNKSYDNILKKTNLLKTKKIFKERENKISEMMNRRISIVQKQINKYDEVYRKITDKMQNLYFKKRKEFEKIIEDESPIQYDLEI